MTRTAAWAVLAAACLAGSAAAQSVPPRPDAESGLAFVTANCGRCHAVGRAGDSPLGPAPRFRELHLRYPVEFLEEALAEGIMTGHQAMPQFVLDPSEIADVIAYLKSLE